MWSPGIKVLHLVEAEVGDGVAAGALVERPAKHARLEPARDGQDRILHPPQAGDFVERDVENPVGAHPRGQELLHHLADQHGFSDAARSPQDDGRCQTRGEEAVKPVEEPPAEGGRAGRRPAGPPGVETLQVLHKFRGQGTMKNTSPVHRLSPPYTALYTHIKAILLTSYHQPLAPQIACR